MNIKNPHKDYRVITEKKRCICKACDGKGCKECLQTGKVTNTVYYLEKKDENENRKENNQMHEPS